MEGLIPIVYRAIKRTKTRSRYECLSTGAAQTYNVDDFHVSSYGTPDTHLYSSDVRSAASGGAGDRLGSGHRRYNTVGDFSFPRGNGEIDRDIGANGQQLVRFRSHKMFSCITGAT